MADDTPTLPSAPLQVLSDHIVLQPPLSRRGSGPGIVLFLPAPLDLTESAHKPLDPEPVLKWAEEGFAVVGITLARDLVLENALNIAISALESLDQVDVKKKFAIIVYAASRIFTISEVASHNDKIAALVGYGSFAAPAFSKEVLLHLTANAPRPRHPLSDITTQYTYPNTSTNFVLPQTVEYDPTSASSAHSRTLVFLRKSLGGPIFDLEAIWDEHTSYEFQDRSVEKTMATMVAEPYVNHVPTMTGGVGRANLTAFYRDHFIFSNPEDATLQVVSRTVGADRVVDEFVYHITHDRQVDWLLPGVPATGKKLAIPMMAVVNIRGDRLYNEHIWWDQATALRQAGILPEYLLMPNHPGQMLRLPVSGAESAQMLVDESKGKSNEMFGAEWGLRKDDSV